MTETLKQEIQTFWRNEKKTKQKGNNLENHETSVLAAPKWTHKIFSNLLPIEPPCSKLTNYTKLQKFKNKINLQQKRAEK